MTDNALTMALGAVAEVKPYGAVVVTVAGSVADARILLPRMLDAMFAHGLVPVGDPAIESNGDGSTAIEVRHAGKARGSRGKLPLVTREDVAASFARTSGAEPLTETVIDSADAKPTAKPKSGRWQQ